MPPKPPIVFLPLHMSHSILCNFIIFHYLAGAFIGGMGEVFIAQKKVGKKQKKK
jgi:hypothetical protein